MNFVTHVDFHLHSMNLITETVEYLEAEVTIIEQAEPTLLINTSISLIKAGFIIIDLIILSFSRITVALGNQYGCCTR